MAKLSINKIHLRGRTVWLFAATFALLLQPVSAAVVSRVVSAVDSSDSSVSTELLQAPAINYPADGKNYTSSSVKLVWYPSGDISNGRHELRLARTAAGLADAEIISTGQSPFKETTFEDGVWYWQVRVRNTARTVYTDWTTPRSFTVSTVIDTPVIISAMSGGRDVKNSSTNNHEVTLNWRAVEGATGYEYGYWNDIAGNQYKETSPSTVIKGAGELSHSGVFNQGEGRHYLAVRSLGAGGVKSDWSVTSVIYDKTQPIINIMSPLANSIVGNGMVGVEVQITEAGSGVEYVNAHFSNGPSADSPKARLALKPGTADVYVGQVDTTSMNGVYRLSVSTRDMARNTRSSAAQNITIDNTAPKINIKDYKGNLNQNVFREVSFGYYDANKAAYAQFNGGKIHNFTDAVWGNTDNVWANRGWTGVVEGLNTVDLYDVAGNKTTFSFIIDNTAPVVELSDWVENNYNPASIKAKITDSYQLGNYYVDLYRPKADDQDSIDYSTKKSLCSASFAGKKEGSDSCALPSDLADGVYWLRVGGFDLAGNSAAPINVSFVVDRTNPVVTLSIDLVNPAEYTINATDVNGVASVTSIIRKTTAANGPEVAAICAKTILANASKDFSVTCAIPADLADGVYNIRYNARDLAGNLVSSRQINFTVDRTVPEITITESTASQISGTVEAGARVFVVVNGQELEAEVDENGSWSLVFNPAFQVGDHTVEVYARDIAGNNSSRIERVISVTAPSVPGPPAEQPVAQVTVPSQGQDFANPIVPRVISAANVASGLFSLGTAPLVTDAATTPPGGEVLAEESNRQEERGSELSDSDNTMNTADEKNNQSDWMKFLQDWWYLVLAGVLALAAFWWFIIAWRRRKDEEDEI